MPYSVSEDADDHIVSVIAATAKDAFAKAAEWDAAGSLSDVSITDGVNRYSIAEFSSVVENAGDDGL